MPVSAKVVARISSELKRYQSILSSAKERDVSEADTGFIVADVLANVLGYDKYHHVTREHAIRGTYVDFAVIVDEQIRFLIEVKAIGIELKDSHVKQAIDYGANLGIEWVLLTNGTTWRAYKIQFGQPIDKTLIFEIDVLKTSPKNPDLIECFGSLSREGFSKPSMSDLLKQKQITGKFAVAATLLTDPMIEALRKELRRLAGFRIDEDYLRNVLSGEVIKRELVESEEASSASALIKKLQRDQQREKKRSENEEGSISAAQPSQGIPSSAASPNTPSLDQAK